MAVIESKKKLGFGMMRLPKRTDTEKGELDNIDVEQVKEMVDTFIARGFTYFDTAWMYHNKSSEQVVKLALTDRYSHDRYTLADKYHLAYVKDGTPEEVFLAQLERCDVEYFDYYLLHDMGHDNYEKFQEAGAFDMMAKMKAEGKIRHVGFSCHDKAPFLDRVLTEHPELEFVQIQLNYLDWDSPGIQAREAYEMITKHNKPVIVMEPVKGGMLANRIPESVEAAFKAYDPDLSVPSWAIRYAAGHDNVAVVLSGMSSMEQLLDNTGYMEDFKPLDEKEQELIRQAVTKINEGIEIQCTGCSYCTAGCPMNIPIPEYFSLYNADQNETRTDWTTQREFYSRTALNSGKVGDCIGCGQCEAICPQHLPIIENLKKVAAYFEGDGDKEA